MKIMVIGGWTRWIKADLLTFLKPWAIEGSLKA